MSIRYILSVAVLLATAGCGGGGDAKKAPAPAAPPPAEVTNRQKEAELATVHLTERAAQRLGITTAEARVRQLRSERQIAGEAMLPPAQSQMLAAPMTGKLEALGLLPAVGTRVTEGQKLYRLTPFFPLQRDLRPTYQAELEQAQARVEAAQLQVRRADQLLKDGAGSQRNLETAQLELTQGNAAVVASQKKLANLDSNPLDADVTLTLTAPITGMVRQVLTYPGQQVNAGVNILEIADLSQMWVRVPVYVGDLPDIQITDSVPIDNLDPGRPSVVKTGTRVAAPPSADPLAATADLYFEVDNADGALRPGQRVGVRLPLKSSGQGLTVPASAVIYDAQGGAWVYIENAPLTYQRRRVDVVRTVSGAVQIARGLTSGQNVVTAGAVELFGTEFGAGK